MNIEFLQKLSKAETDYLWSKGVDLDDWDYLLIMEYAEDYFNADNTPKSYVLGQLLTGCYRNVWYRVNFRGSEKILGVAYHS